MDVSEGEEAFRRISKIYCKEAVAFMIVFNVNEAPTFALARECLDQLRTFYGKLIPPVVLLGKFDPASFTAVPKKQVVALMSDYPEIKKYMQTDVSKSMDVAVSEEVASLARNELLKQPPVVPVDPPRVDEKCVALANKLQSYVDRKKGCYDDFTISWESRRKNRDANIKIAEGIIEQLRNRESIKLAFSKIGESTCCFFKRVSSEGHVIRSTELNNIVREAKALVEAEKNEATPLLKSE